LQQDCSAAQSIFECIVSCHIQNFNATKNHNSIYFNWKSYIIVQHIIQIDDDKYYKCGSQSVLAISYYDFCCGRSIATDLTVRNSRSDRVMLDTTSKEAYLTDVAIHNSHCLYSTIIKKLQK
jgi:hypothetical protein